MIANAPLLFVFLKKHANSFQSVTQMHDDEKCWVCGGPWKIAPHAPRYVVPYVTSDDQCDNAHVCAKCVSGQGEHEDLSDMEW